MQSNPDNLKEAHLLIEAAIISIFHYSLIGHKQTWVHIPYRWESKEPLHIYSYTSNLLLSSMQNPINMTTFRCWAQLSTSTSEQNSWSPWELANLCCLTATTWPSGRTPLWTDPYPPSAKKLACENPPVASSSSVKVNNLGGFPNTGALCWHIEHRGGGPRGACLVNVPDPLVFPCVSILDS